MQNQMMIDLNKSYRVSETVVAKEIEGELVIIPLKAGLGDLNAEMYALNATGIAVWKKLDGTRSLTDIISMLSDEYEQAREKVQLEITELINLLLEKGLILEV